MRNIYLAKIETKSGPLYKIGVSKDVNKRLKQLQTGNPFVITLVERFPTKYAFKIEAALHVSYKINNVEGEWFDIDITEYSKKVDTLHNGFRSLDEGENHYFKV